MANNEFDKPQPGDAMMAKLLAAKRTDGAAIDIRTGPSHCQIYMNRPAVVDLIKKLQTAVDMSLTTTGVCVTFVDDNGITLLSIETDDQTAPN